MTYNQEKYLKYKKKQEELGKKQINLVLEERIANALQEELKGKNKILFEYKLKSYFFSKNSPDLLEKLTNTNRENQDLNKLVDNIDLILNNLHTKLSEFNNRIKTIEQKLHIDKLTYPDNHIVDINIKNLETTKKSIKKISPQKTSVRHKKISNNHEMLDLAIDLYKEIKSWTQVSLQLAKRGYLSRKNTPYTSSNLSRAVSRYQNQYLGS